MPICHTLYAMPFMPCSLCHALPIVSLLFRFHFARFLNLIEWYLGEECNLDFIVAIEIWESLMEAKSCSSYV